MKTMRFILDLYREAPADKRQQIRHDIWPSWVGIGIIRVAWVGLWWWGKWVTLSLDSVALAFILLSGSRVIPRWYETEKRLRDLLEAEPPSPKSRVRCSRCGIVREFDDGKVNYTYPPTSDLSAYDPPSLCRITEHDWVIDQER